MKVIFLQDVPKVARAGDIKEVASGYGRNFLIPKKLAIPANLATTKALEVQLQIKARHQAQAEAELAELAKQLDGKEIILKAQAGAKDRLYGSITAADIAAELQNTTGIDIDKRKIELDKPIHQLGSYEVAIKFAKDIMSKIRVTVVEKETGTDNKADAEKKTSTKKSTNVKKKTLAEKETDQSERGETAAA